MTLMNPIKTRNMGKCVYSINKELRANVKKYQNKHDFDRSRVECQKAGALKISVRVFCDLQLIGE